MWKCPLTQSPPHAHLSPWLTSHCGWSGAGGVPRSTSALGQKTPLYFLNSWSVIIRLNSDFHHKNSTKSFSLWYSTECCLHFFIMGMTRYNIVTQGSSCVKMKKINFISPKGTKVSQVWRLLFYQRSFEWIKMRGTRNWVKILYLRAA